MGLKPIPVSEKLKADKAIAPILGLAGRCRPDLVQRQLSTVNLIRLLTIWL